MFMIPQGDDSFSFEAKAEATDPIPRRLNGNNSCESSARIARPGKTRPLMDRIYKPEP
jgi:hypothetical protein